MENSRQEERVIGGPSLASNLRWLRRRKELSQEELAQLVGLNRGNIASYENGTAEPKIGSLIRLSEYFGVPFLDLVTVNLEDEQQSASRTRLHGLCPQERAKLEQLYVDALEFEAFLNGIHTCFSFKSRNLQEVENLPQEALFLKSHFEQLHSATQHLLQQHLRLLGLCRVKE